jgi:hypothetical protein
MFLKEAGQNIWYNIQKVSRVAKGSTVTEQSEIESCIEKDRQKHKTERSRIQKGIEDAVRIYKGEVYLLRICQSQVNGILEPARRVKIQEFDSFSRCKSREGGFRVSHDITLKMTSRTRVEANGEKEYENLKFSAYYETAKFKGGQSD